jgi:hypothetical protein
MSNNASSTQTGSTTAGSTTVGSTNGSAGKRAASSVRPRTVETPWGRATVVERISVPQRAGDRRFESVVELLDGGKGERFVRFGYATGGVVRRGPLTLRLRDLPRLRRVVGSRAPQLAETLGWEEGSA